LIANKQIAGQEEGTRADIADAAAVRRATCTRPFQTKSSGYNTRLPPRFFAHIRDKLLQAHLRSGLNRVPRTE
jgi:hypothetical protein